MNRFLGIFLFFCLSFSGYYNVYAQDSLYATLRSEARMFFDSRNYESALPKFRELLHRFSKEPEYQYGTAVCLTKLNREPEEAIVLLRSVNSSEYNPMSWYYLGLLLHRNYLFDDAIRAYSKFMLLGKPADVKALDVKRQIEMAKNGIDFTRRSLDFRVLDMKTLLTNKLEEASEINGSGKMIKKPIEFCSKSDLREGYRPLMYLPVYTEMNEYVFVSGFEKFRKDRRQIYRVRNINHETWSLPEPLNDGINTAYDDEYPYFDARTSSLYFSSKGHSSMGGYDIFRSVYDWNTKTWSKPENLGFPINSTYDDYFYMTDDFSQTASFVTNRNTVPGKVTLYKIRMSPDSVTFMLGTIDEIQNASNLPMGNGTTAGTPPYYEIPGKIPVSQESAFKPVSPETYSKVLSEALILQLMSDSLDRIARENQIKARETADDEKRKQHMSDMRQAEKESANYQLEADRKFTEAGKLKDPEGTIIYRSSQDEMLTDPRDKFRILDRSPYGPSNPIPQGMQSYAGLVYQIQLGVFSKPKPDDAFGGISPVFFEQDGNTRVCKYFAGLFYSFNAVSGALEQVRKKGFPDAFVVPFLDGKPVTMEQAKEIEFAGFKL